VELFEKRVTIFEARITNKQNAGGGGTRLAREPPHREWEEMRTRCRGPTPPEETGGDGGEGKKKAHARGLFKPLASAPRKEKSPLLMLSAKKIPGFMSEPRKVLRRPFQLLARPGDPIETDTN